MCILQGVDRPDKSVAHDYIPSGSFLPAFRFCSSVRLFWETVVSTVLTLVSMLFNVSSAPLTRSCVSCSRVWVPFSSCVTVAWARLSCVSRLVTRARYWSRWWPEDVSSRVRLFRMSSRRLCATSSLACVLSSLPWVTSTRVCRSNRLV